MIAGDSVDDSIQKLAKNSRSSAALNGSQIVSGGSSVKSNLFPEVGGSMSVGRLRKSGAGAGEPSEYYSTIDQRNQRDKRTQGAALNSSMRGSVEKETPSRGSSVSGAEKLSLL